MTETEGEEITLLPMRFALKSIYNKEYLEIIHEDNELYGFLKYSGKKVVSPYAKFEVENAKRGKGLVHIRCSYNNKYWVLRSPSSHYIVAAASEAEEDESKDSCTLFKPMYDHDLGAFRFRHVQLDRNLCLDWQVYGPYRAGLFQCSSRAERDRSDLSTVVNWDSLFILPKYVAFKGNNGHYFRPSHYRDTVYLQFSARDVGDPGVKNEVFTTVDGHVRINSIPYGKFWVRDPNWIHVKSSETAIDDPNTLFWPIKLDNNGVALRNLGNNHLCKRLTLDGKENCLNAGIDYITDEVRLEITELVLSRDIYNVNLRLSDARIYDEKPHVMASGVVENRTSVADKLSLKLSYEDTTTMTWSSSIWAKLGVKMTISTGVLVGISAEISEGEIEISAEISEEYAWGETQQSKNLVEVVHDIVVPPSSKVKTSIIATQGTCDVPFSYTQRDKLTNGRVVSQRLDDGVYTGVNCYNYQFLTEEL